MKRKRIEIYDAPRSSNGVRTKTEEEISAHLESAKRQLKSIKNAKVFHVNDETTRELYKLIGAIWRRCFATSFYPVPRSTHDCDAQYCEIEQVIAHYSLGAPMSDLAQSDSTYDILHVCVRVIRRDGIVVVDSIDADQNVNTNVLIKCAGRYMEHSPEHIEFIKNDTIYSGVMEDVFICSKTGHMHVCTSDMCDYATNPEHTHGDRVCRLTGRVLSERGLVSEFWTPSSVKASSGESFGCSEPVQKSQESNRKMSFSHMPYTKSSGDDAMIELLMLDDMSSRDAPMQDISAIDNHLKWRRRRRTANRHPYSEYILTGALRISILFSRMRYHIDLRLSKEASRLANRDVYKQFRSGKGDDAISLLITQAHALKNRFIPDNLVLCSTDRQNFLLSYAKRCLQLWTIIRTRTKIGREERNAFPFSDFVIAAMYIFKSGIYLPPEITHGPGEQILEEDLLLQRCLPRYEVLDELQCNLALIARVQSSISRAIIQAVRDDRIDTARLHPNSIQPEFLNKDVYKNMRKQKNKRTDK